MKAVIGLLFAAWVVGMTAAAVKNMNAVKASCDRAEGYWQEIVAADRIYRTEGE